MKVYLERVTSVFVMYYIYETFRASLLIESIDSMRNIENKPIMVFVAIFMSTVVLIMCVSLSRVTEAVCSQDGL